MSLYLGHKKVAGNNTNEFPNSDLKSYKVTFDDNGESEDSTIDDILNTEIKSENLLNIILSGIKKTLVLLNKLLNKNIEDVQTLNRNLTSVLQIKKFKTSNAYVIPSGNEKEVSINIDIPSGFKPIYAMVYGSNTRINATPVYITDENLNVISCYLNNYFKSEIETTIVADVFFIRK